MRKRFNYQKLMVLAELVLIAPFVWCLGWFLYDLGELWLYWSNRYFQNGLVILIIACYLIAFLFLRGRNHNSVKLDDEMLGDLRKLAKRKRDELIQGFNERMKVLEERLDALEAFKKVEEKQTEPDLKGKFESLTRRVNVLEEQAKLSESEKITVKKEKKRKEELTNGTS